MTFNEFISKLNVNEKRNFDYYSQIRGVQQYKIIFETLSKIDSNITYNDVNSFIKYDKGIKDILYVYLGSLEEYIKVYIFSKYDFKNDVTHKKNISEYNFFSQIHALIEPKNVPLDEITELYKMYALNFKDMVDLLKEKEPNGKFNTDDLYKIKDLRNDVMHHSPLLFNIDGTDKVRETEELIKILYNTLPLNYPKYLAKDLNKKTRKYKEKLNNKFYDLLLQLF